jgi:uncharacterized protein (DUF2236 family)
LVDEVDGLFCDRVQPVIGLGRNLREERMMGALKSRVRMGASTVPHNTRKHTHKNTQNMERRTG